jgi:outer membrane immunogenic protein
MRNLFLVSSALVCAAAPAMAADLAPMPMKAPAVVAVPAMWSGCYVGGNVGAGWNHTSFTDAGNDIPGLGTVHTFAPIGNSVSTNGGASVVGGVQVGCDYEFSNHWVIGIGGDFAWTNINGIANDPFFNGKNGAPIQFGTQTKQIGSVTGRVGYAWDHFLLYGKGGAAYAHDNYNINNANCLFVTCGNLVGSSDRAGWTAGVGLEWAFAQNWSALVEYDHYGFGNKGVGFISPATAPGALIFPVKQDVDVVKVGINYRFGLGGPVVARY